MRRGVSEALKSGWGHTAPPAFPIYVGDMLVITVIAATKSVRKIDDAKGWVSKRGNSLVACTDATQMMSE